MWKNSDGPRGRGAGAAGWAKRIAGAAACILGVSLAIGSGGEGRAQQAAVTPEAQPLHILVGKSVVINLETKVKRILVSNPEVIDALATTPSQVVVTAKMAGASSLILWDQSDNSRILDVTVDLDVTGLRTAIERAFPNGAIQAQADGGRLILSGTVADQHSEDDLVKMASIYSKDVVDSLDQAAGQERRQILLEVKIAEVDRTKMQQFGFNLLSTGAGNTPGSVGTQEFGPPAGSGGGPATLTSAIGAPAQGFTTSFGLTNLLNIFLFNPTINLGATIEDLTQRNIMQILAAPNLLALNGQKASFLAGGEFPFPVLQGGTTIGAVTIQFRPFGVKLEFTGFIGPDNTVRLQVSPEVSTLDYTNAITISGFTVPAISTRRADTAVELRDGQSFGIAGLLDQRVTTELSKIPGIGDLPVIGQLFRSKSDQRTRTELVVLVTPHIVDPLRSGAQMTSTPKPAIPYLDKPAYDKSLPGNQAPAPKKSQ